MVVLCVITKAVPSYFLTHSPSPWFMHRLDIDGPGLPRSTNVRSDHLYSFSTVAAYCGKCQEPPAGEPVQFASQGRQH